MHVNRRGRQQSQRDVATAKSLADVALAAGADSVKFQVINPEGLDLPAFPTAEGYVDNEVIAARRATQLSDEQYAEIAAHCADAGIEFSASVFDIDGIALLDRLDVGYMKIASCDLTNVRLVRAALGHWPAGRALDRDGLGRRGRATIDALGVDPALRFVLLHCVSVYPAGLEQMNLGFLAELGALRLRGRALPRHAERDGVGDGGGARRNLVREALHARSQPGRVDHGYALEPAELEAYVAEVRPPPRRPRAPIRRSAAPSARLPSGPGAPSTRRATSPAASRSPTRTSSSSGPRDRSTPPTPTRSSAGTATATSADSRPSIGRQFPLSGIGALFVCRGSVADGLGHVMRTRAVADASPDALEAELVVIGSEHAEQVLEGTAAEVSVVAGEAEAVAIAERSSAQIVVFDLTKISAEAFKAITAGRVSASLSPIFPFLDWVDLRQPDALHRTGPQPAAEGRYYGLDYAFVRPECRRIDSAPYARGLEEESISIAISLGGADRQPHPQVLGELRSLDTRQRSRSCSAGLSHSYNELVDPSTTIAP